MHGYKQPHRAWLTKLDNNITGLGLKCADFDCFVYYKIIGKNILLIAVYVGDLHA